MGPRESAAWKALAKPTRSGDTGSSRPVCVFGASSRFATGLRPAGPFEREGVKRIRMLTVLGILAVAAAMTTQSADDGVDLRNGSSARSPRCLGHGSRQALFVSNVLLPRERSSTAEALTIRSRHINFIATADLGAASPGRRCSCREQERRTRSRRAGSRIGRRSPGPRVGVQRD